LNIKKKIELFTRPSKKALRGYFSIDVEL